MTVDILEKIFGSQSRLKIMKLFLFHPEEVFDKDDVVKKTKVNATLTNKELKLLQEVGFIKQKSFFKEVKLKSGPKKKRVKGYVLEPTFTYMNHFKNLLLNTEPLAPNQIVKRVGKGGKMKLIVLAGVFIKSDDSRIDLLVVGDEVKEKVIKNVVGQMEAEIGKELRYSVLSTDDFKYRQSVCDRLLRDVFDYPHRVVIDKIGL